MTLLSGINSGGALLDKGGGRHRVKGEVQPTPAFRLLRVGADLCVNESRCHALSGRYCIFGFQRRFTIRDHEQHVWPLFASTYSSCSLETDGSADYRT